MYGASESQQQKRSLQPSEAQSGTASTTFSRGTMRRPQTACTGGAVCAAASKSSSVAPARSAARQRPTVPSLGENLLAGGPTRRSPRAGQGYALGAPTTSGSSRSFGAGLRSNTNGAGTGARGPLADMTNISFGCGKAQRMDIIKPFHRQAGSSEVLGQTGSNIFDEFPQQQRQPMMRSSSQVALHQRPPVRDQHSHATPAPVASTPPPPLLPRPTLSLTQLEAEADAEDRLRYVGEYMKEIIAQLFRDEALSLPRPNYIETQPEINSKMRAILVDWLVEVHIKYKLRPETLFLTVNLIDRYLSRQIVVRKRLQLVGIVAMLIASKYEEIEPPEVNDFAYICDNAYTKEDILQMECTMLTTLGFEISAPTAVHFFNCLHRANYSNASHREVARYLIELALVEMRMIRHTPSLVSAAATLVSNELLNRQPAWPPCMVQHARYTEEQLRPCAIELGELLEAAPGNSLQAVRKRFLSEQHHCVAGMTFPAAATSSRGST